MHAGYGTVLTVRRQRRDDDGDLGGPAVDVVLRGYEIAPEGSTERADGARETTTERVAAYGGPPQPDLRPGDLVYLEGDPRHDAQGRPVPPPWYVVGAAEDWGSSTWQPGHVVKLQRHRQQHQR
jgi:hypothetical protein